MVFGKLCLSLLPLVLTFVYFTQGVDGFTCPSIFGQNIHLTTKTSISMNKVPGSFFNQIPENEGNDDDDDKDDETKQVSNAADPFEMSLSEVMKKRTEKPIAATPSTINGKSTAKGFGMASPKKSKSDEYIGIGPPDTIPRKPLNDVNNLEYDDQGYTLYADEKTGKKSRVFEALINYPCKFKIKIVGANEGTFVEEMVALVAESCNVKADEVAFSEKRNGKWISVTVHAPVESAEMLYALYEDIDRDPRVKFKF